MLNNENQLDEIIPESELLNQPTAKQSDFQVTPEQEEEILTKIKNYMELANKNYDNQEASIIKRYEKYYATEDHYATVFPKLSKVSQYCSSDISDVIEWALPSLIKAFLGTDDICEIKGMTPEDDDNAEVMKELVNWQLTKKNQVMIIFYNWFKDALITAFGIIKVQWQREEANIEKEEFVNSQTLMSYLQSGMNIVGAEQKGNDLYNLTYLQNAVTKNQPIIENLKFSEFRFIDGYKRITDCPFVAHVKKITKSDLKYKEKLGVYSNVDMATEKSNSNYTSKALDNLFKANKSDTPHMFTEKSMEEFELWECFVKIDIDNDGIAEDWIITIVNEVFLRAERNTYGRQPFFILSPWQDPHSLMPESSFSDKLAPIQDLKTALIKQAMYAIAQSNDPKTYINEQDININDLILNKQFIRTRGNKNMRDVVYHAPQVPLNNNTFPMIEFLSGERENRTGITRYNQGLDANSLNKTATGISAIMSASNQRLELIVRIFAETGMKDLLLFLIQLNQKFYNQEQVIRLTNKELVIRPEDIRGQFDLTVSSGAGMATKEANAMNLQTMINTMMQLRNAGLSIITEQNIYETIKKYIENMGYKNTSTFVTEPSEIQKYQMLEQMAIQELFTMLPPQAQQKIMMMLEQSQGEMTQDILNILMMVAPSLPPEGQQLIQILFGGMINNGNVPLGISGAVQQSGQSYGSNAINQGSFRGNEGADNKSFMPHDRY